jgi:probable F420-dependent oxidoreductase
MKFGIFLLSQHHREDSPAERFHELMEQAELAEAVGFDALWVGDHHVVDDTYFPPLTVLAGLATRTSRVVLGTSILLLPLYHPLHVAESLAMLDVMSGGRVILGVAAGYRAEECAAFGVPFDERLSRLEEGVELLRRFWTEPVVTHTGRHYRFEQVRISVEPQQRPIPVWVGANSPAALRLTARLGDAWLADPISDLATLERYRDIYTAALQAAGKPRPQEMVTMREGFCLPDGDRAVQVVRPHLTEKYQKYAAWSFAPVVQSGDIFDTLMQEERFVIGDPEACIAKIQRYQDFGLTHMVMRIQHIGMPQAEVLQAIRTFGEQVLPYCRDAS